MTKVRLHLTQCHAWSVHWRLENRVQTPSIDVPQLLRVGLLWAGWQNRKTPLGNEGAVKNSYLACVDRQGILRIDVVAIQGSPDGLQVYGRDPHSSLHEFLIVLSCHLWSTAKCTNDNLDVRLPLPNQGIKRQDDKVKNCSRLQS